MSGAVDTARPYVERIAQDDELHDHVKKAYSSAKSIYDELLGNQGAQAVAMRVAKDKDIQDELRKAVEELRKAGERAQGKESHSGRNITLLLVGHHARRSLQPGDRPRHAQVAEGQGPRPRAAVRGAVLERQLERRQPGGAGGAVSR